jgi:hypothetical protein
VISGFLGLVGLDGNGKQCRAAQLSARAVSSIADLELGERLTRSTGGQTCVGPPPLRKWARMQVVPTYVQYNGRKSKNSGALLFQAAKTCSASPYLGAERLGNRDATTLCPPSVRPTSQGTDDLPLFWPPTRYNTMSISRRACTRYPGQNSAACVGFVTSISPILAEVEAFFEVPSTYHHRNAHIDGQPRRLWQLPAGRFTECG